MRALLLKGADREARDLKGRRPIDEISENMPSELVKELKTMLVRLRLLIIDNRERLVTGSVL